MRTFSQTFTCLTSPTGEPATDSAKLERGEPVLRETSGSEELQQPGSASAQALLRTRQARLPTSIASTKENSITSAQERELQHTFDDSLELGIRDDGFLFDAQRLHLVENLGHLVIGRVVDAHLFKTEGH